jgi:hypothetical protein
MIIIKNTKNKCQKGCGGQGMLIPYCWDINQYNICGNKYEVPQKTKNKTNI